MSYWIEVHCDVRSETPDRNGKVCFGHTNDHPAALGQTPQIAIRAARVEAMRRHWRQRPGVGWVCPHCQKHSPARPDDNPSDRAAAPKEPASLDTLRQDVDFHGSW